MGYRSAAAVNPGSRVPDRTPRTEILAAAELEGLVLGTQDQKDQSLARADTWPFGLGCPSGSEAVVGLSAGDHLVAIPNAEDNARVAVFGDEVRIELDLLLKQFADDKTD